MPMGPQEVPSVAWRSCRARHCFVATSSQEHRHRKRTDEDGGGMEGEEHVGEVGLTRGGDGGVFIGHK